MEQQSESTGLALVGAALLALAAYFVWRDLGVGAEYLLMTAATAAAVAQVIQRPRRWPDLGLTALLGCTVVAGGWFAGGAFFGLVDGGRFHPLLLVATMGVAVAGCVAAAARLYLTRDGGPLPAQVVFPITCIGLILSMALYYQFFTVGFAAEHVGRRLILTLTWLPLGLLMQARGHGTGDRNLARAGLLVVACAVSKAVFYDTTHLDGGLRILVLAAAGLLLLGGAGLVRRAQPRVDA
jgi:uncharacterized membrane protein